MFTVTYCVCVCVPWCMGSPSRQDVWACLSLHHSHSSRRWRSPCRCVCVSVHPVSHIPSWWNGSPHRAGRLPSLGSDASSANETLSHRLVDKSEMSSHYSLHHPDHSSPPTESEKGRDRQTGRETVKWDRQKYRQGENQAYFKDMQMYCMFFPVSLMKLFTIKERLLNF